MPKDHVAYNPENSKNKNNKDQASSSSPTANASKEQGGRNVPTTVPDQHSTAKKAKKGTTVGWVNTRQNRTVAHNKRFLKNLKATAQRIQKEKENQEG
eukprot:1340150-Ditylum_brightwellii.AAC.1